MRVEPYTIGSCLHVIKRGARGLEIVRDESDHWRFVRMLFLLNDEHFDKDWYFSAKDKPIFYRPESWAKRESIVDILAYTLMPNHFHLILREIKEGGVSKFMRRLGQSMTNYTNEKYQEQGSIFQGSYRARTIDIDKYLQYVAAYVMVKNTLELYPHNGLTGAQKDFDAAWNWAIAYPFSSIGDYAGVREKSPILAKGLLGELFTPRAFKSFARDHILGGKWTQQEKQLE